MKKLKQVNNITKILNFNDSNDNNYDGVNVKTITCPKCGGELRIITYPNGEVRKTCLDCDEIEYQKEIDKKFNIKDVNVAYNKKHCGFKPRDFETVNQKYKTDKGNIDAYNVAMEYANKFNKETSIGLYIYGLVGVGKSLLAKRVMAIAINNGYSGYITTITNLMNDIKKDINNLRDDTMRKCLDVDLLVIDDIGTEKTTDWQSEQLFLLIDKRFDSKKPIIYTSNLKLDDIVNKYDVHGRIYSRISGATKLLEIKGADKRKIPNK